MKADRLAELAGELRAAGHEAVVAEGGLREAVNAEHWTAAHRALDELCAAREKRAELEAEVEQVIESPTDWGRDITWGPSRDCLRRALRRPFSLLAA
jgi:hypothetical protein